ncbi:MAG: NAD-dependent deacylase [Deltaproteobacteria bacterium]|nr:NAD-dependent deacylase [Deltaproteobacteria bacterium]MBW2306099.1 NAD-dependent deacylase [Deltaproteobacteria bacterium]
MDQAGRDIERAAELIFQSQRIVVFTGAGVSTESGIPDFRSPGGIWTTFEPEDFTIQRFLSSPETRIKIWTLGRAFKFQQAFPNAAHHAIVDIEKMGKLSAVITQNIDNLHQRAGNRPTLVVELHGNMQEVVCTSCRALWSWEQVEQRVLAGEGDPRCKQCGGILKPNAVFFGEPLPVHAFMKAHEKSCRCDLFVVIGSSLVVYPAAEMPRYAKSNGAKLMIINLSDTDQDYLADMSIKGSAGEVMPRIINAVEKRMKSAVESHLTSL